MTYSLNLDPDKIHIDKSIRTFKSTHRKTLERKLDGEYSVTQYTEERINKEKKQLIDVYEKTMRNEKIIDDSIEILGLRSRNRLALTTLEDKYKQLLSKLETMI